MWLCVHAMHAVAVRQDPGLQGAKASDAVTSIIIIIIITVRRDINNIASQLRSTRSAVYRCTRMQLSKPPDSYLYLLEKVHQAFLFYFITSAKEPPGLKGLAPLIKHVYTAYLT